MFTTVESYFQGFAGRKRSLEAFINSILYKLYYRLILLPTRDVCNEV